jgi:hypothetical protein
MGQEGERKEEMGTPQVLISETKPFALRMASLFYEFFKHYRIPHFAS